VAVYAAGLLAEGESDGRAYTKHIVRVEPLIVLDVVVVTLGTHEDVGQAVPEVIAEAGAEIFHKVIAAGVVNASGGAAGSKEVEAVAGDADTGQNVEAKFPGQLGLEEDVNVSEDGTIIFVPIVASLVISPGGFYVNAEAMPEGDDVSAEAGVDATFFGRRLKGHDVAGGGERRENATADQDISLLGRGEVGEQKNGTRGKQQREFSQYKSLVTWFGLPEFRLVLPRRSSHEWPRPGETPGLPESAAPAYQNPRSSAE
jgi:hypothetical protein